MHTAWRVGYPIYDAIRACKRKADLALIAQGRKVMKRPEGNTKDLKITLVIWSKSADKHLTEDYGELHTQGVEPVT